MGQTVAEKIRFWSIPIGIVIIAGLLITVIVLQVRSGNSGEPAASGDSGEVTAQEEQPDLTFLETRSATDVQAAGDTDAPVTLIVFSDYQCPYCARWNEDTLPALMPQVDAGNLRIEWRDINVMGPQSEVASRAAHAAGMQGRYWEYHSELFPEGDIRPANELEEDSLVTIAEGLDLDPVQFREDMNSETTFARIQNYESIGRDIGVQSTPAFILGGEPILGAQPTDVFLDAYERIYTDSR